MTKEEFNDLKEEIWSDLSEEITQAFIDFENQWDQLLKDYFGYEKPKEGA